MQHDNPVRRSLGHAITEAADPLDHLQPLADVAEDRVVRLQAGIRRGDDEELAARGAAWLRSVLLSGAG